MEPDLSHVRIAVLIDADNTSPKYAEDLLDEIAKYGNPTIKRAYGDWSSPHLQGWAKELNARAIRGMHQNAFTSGKNSTDSALIIDAMDLLYANNVEAFALVTSDSDFTSLALRLRESGKTVYGLGRNRTPVSLQNACDKFIQLEVLGDRDDSAEAGSGIDPESDTDTDAVPSPKINLQSALTKAVNGTADESGWSSLGAIGNHLSRIHSAFDPRAFGHAKLSSLVSAQHYLEVEGEAGQLRIRVKGRSAPRAAARKAPEKTPEKAPERASEKETAAKATQKPDTVPAQKKSAKSTRKTSAAKKAAAEAPASETTPAASTPASPEPSPKPTVTRRTRTSRTAKKAAGPA